MISGRAFSRSCLLFCVMAAGAALSAASPRIATPAIQTQATPVVAVPLPWSATQLLSWSDFQGPPPADGDENARTVYNLSFESRCRGEQFTYKVTALFFPADSWVKPQVLADGVEKVRVLEHEQTHFNLTEVYARRMRRYFAGLYNPCGQTEAAINGAVDRFAREEGEAQQRYETETNHGLISNRQLAWNRDVNEMLTSLTAFAR